MLQVIILLMSGRLEGSFPRRLLKRTHNRNPTFHSFNLFGLLQPDSAAEPAPPVRNSPRPAYSFHLPPGPPPLALPEKSFMDSYLPQPDHHFLAERGRKSLLKEGREVGEWSVRRAKSTIKVDADSLHQAEDEFLKNKLRNPEYFISGGAFKAEERRESRVVDLSPRSTSIKRCSSIVEKQRAGYDIISNIAAG